jgi:hypothetical protein
MEPNNYNAQSLHIISETVIAGGMFMYFFKKISELESTIENLKNQVAMQNNQIQYLLSSKGSFQPLNRYQLTTPLISKSFTPGANNNHFGIDKPNTSFQSSTLQQQPTKPMRSEQECENGVCRLVPRKDDKKVVISKVSKQIEFDRENMELDQTSKVSTFNNFSPNPLIKSVTPKPSLSTTDDNCGENELEKILNEIDDE